MTFALKIVIKEPFLSLNDIFWKMKKHFSVLKEDLFLWICNLPYSSPLEHEEIKRSPCSLFHSVLRADRNLLRSRANSWVPMCGLHYTNSLKASWLRFDRHPDLSSSLNDMAPEWNFENHFRICRSLMTPLPWTLHIFLASSEVFLSFLNSNNL